jgi:glycosyltransferase involved in cell wall biosynthesis
LSPVFVDGDPAIGKDYIQVSLDGSKHSVAETQGVMQLLGRLAGGGNRTRLLVIHSLINFDEEHILREILGIAWTRKYYWLHDYSAVCSETHLLRNGITFCGCPPMESMACFTCTGYKSRHKKEDIIRWLLHEGFTFVTPSEAARNIVTRSGAFNGETVRVVPHVKLERSISLRKKIRNSRNTVRVAYCGYPSYHKGWHVFERVVDRSVHLGQYRFFHFGAEQRSLSCVEFVRVESSPESPDEMVKALRDRDVDIVLIASPWPETFCFVAVESILAGCMIATTRAAGNVAAFASSVPHVVVFSSPEELVNAFASGEMAHRVAKEMSKGLPVFNAKREGTTAALEANCD